MSFSFFLALSRRLSRYSFPDLVRRSHRIIIPSCLGEKTIPKEYPLLHSLRYNWNMLSERFSAWVHMCPTTCEVCSAFRTWIYRFQSFRDIKIIWTIITLEGLLISGRRERFLMISFFSNEYSLACASNPTAVKAWTRAKNF